MIRGVPACHDFNVVNVKGASVPTPEVGWVLVEVVTRGDLRGSRIIQVKDIDGCNRRLCCRIHPEGASEKAHVALETLIACIGSSPKHMHEAESHLLH